MMDCKKCPVKDQCKKSKERVMGISIASRKEDFAYVGKQLKKFCPLGILIDNEIQDTGRKIVCLTNDLFKSEINRANVEQKIDELYN